MAHMASPAPAGQAVGGTTPNPMTGSPNSFTPTSTNDLMTPVTARRSSPWRDLKPLRHGDPDAGPVRDGQDLHGPAGGLDPARWEASPM